MTTTSPPTGRWVTTGRRDVKLPRVPRAVRRERWPGGTPPGHAAHWSHHEYKQGYWKRLIRQAWPHWKRARRRRPSRHVPGRGTWLPPLRPR